MPSFDPGWLETTTPELLPPPLLLGGALTSPASSAPPKPAPRLPRPWPLSDPPADGGGGTTDAPEPIPPTMDRCDEPAPICTVGGTTDALPSPLTARCCDEMPAT